MFAIEDQSNARKLCTLAFSCEVSNLMTFVALHLIFAVSLRAVFCDMAMLVAAIALRGTLGLVALSGKMTKLSTIVAARTRVISSSMVSSLSIYTKFCFTTRALPGLVANPSTVIAGHIIIPSI